MEPKPKMSSSDTTKLPAKPTAADATSASNDDKAATAAAAVAVSKPYVYRDFAQDDTDYGGDADIPSSDGRGLTNQKLPAKLNAMLSDPGEYIVDVSVCTIFGRINMTVMITFDYSHEVWNCTNNQSLTILPFPFFFFIIISSSN